MTIRYSKNFESYGRMTTARPRRSGRLIRTGELVTQTGDVAFDGLVTVRVDGAYGHRTIRVAPIQVQWDHGASPYAFSQGDHEVMNWFRQQLANMVNQSLITGKGFFELPPGTPTGGLLSKDYCAAPREAGPEMHLPPEPSVIPRIGVDLASKPDMTINVTVYPGDFKAEPEASDFRKRLMRTASAPTPPFEETGETLYGKPVRRYSVATLPGEDTISEVLKHHSIQVSDARETHITWGGKRIWVDEHGYLHSIGQFPTK